jgi:hypothetical protein
MNMRDIIALIESATSFPAVSPALIQQVRSRIKAGTHYGDYEVPEDDEELGDDIGSILFNISANTFSVDGGIKLWRAEMRPRSDLTKNGVSTLGVFWAWQRDRAGAIYGSDYGSEIHSGKTYTGVFEAVVPLTSINWPATIAANLAMPMEREVTLLQDSKVHLVSVTVGKKVVAVDRAVVIDNLTAYDQGDF